MAALDRATAAAKTTIEAAKAEAELSHPTVSKTPRCHNPPGPRLGATPAAELSRAIMGAMVREILLAQALGKKRAARRKSPAVALPALPRTLKKKKDKKREKKIEKAERILARSSPEFQNFKAQLREIREEAYEHKKWHQIVDALSSSFKESLAQVIPQQQPQPQWRTTLPENEIRARASMAAEEAYRKEMESLSGTGHPQQHVPVMFPPPSPFAGFTPGVAQSSGGDHALLPAPRVPLASFTPGVAQGSGGNTASVPDGSAEIPGVARRWLEAELGHKVSLEDGDKKEVVKPLVEKLEKREVATLPKQFVERHGGGVPFPKAKSHKAELLIEIALGGR